jgi:hypothetical protein
MIDIIKSDPFGFFLFYPLFWCNAFGLGWFLSFVIMP